MIGVSSISLAVSAPLLLARSRILSSLSSLRTPFNFERRSVRCFDVEVDVDEDDSVAIGLETETDDEDEFGTLFAVSGPPADGCTGSLTDLDRSRPDLFCKNRGNLEPGALLGAREVL